MYYNDMSDFNDPPILTQKENSESITKFSSILQEYVYTQLKSNEELKKIKQGLDKNSINDKQFRKEFLSEQEKVWSDSKLGGMVNSINDSFNKMKETTRSNMEGLSKSLTTGLLGPLNMITKPLGDFFGADLIGWLFKEKKVKPKESSLLKNGGAIGASMVWFKRWQEGNLEEDRKKGIGEFFTNLLGGLATGLGPVVGKMLMKAGGLALIIGGLVWMAIDGFKAFFKAEDWGTSKGAAVLGGVLGGTSSGFEGAFKNMGKWALLGAGVGTMIAPGLGTLAGGLLGAAIGGILGYIGGEDLAKGFDMIGKNITKTLNAELSSEDKLSKNVAERQVEEFKKQKNIFERVLDGIILYGGIAITSVIDGALGFVNSLNKAFVEPFRKIWEDEEFSLPEKIIGTILQVPQLVINAFVSVGDLARLAFSWPIDALLSLGNFFGGLFPDTVGEIMKPINKGWEIFNKGFDAVLDVVYNLPFYIMKGVKIGFNATKDFILNLPKNISTGFDIIKTFFKDKVGGFFKNLPNILISFLANILPEDIKKLILKGLNLKDKLMGIITNTLIPNVKNFIFGIPESIKNIFIGLFTGDKEKIEKEVSKNKDFLGNIVKSVSSIGSLIVDFIVNGINTVVRTIKGVVKLPRDFLDKNVKPVINNFLGNIIDKVMGGVNIAKNFVKDNILKPINKFISPFINGVKDFFGSIADTFRILGDILTGDPREIISKLQTFNKRQLEAESVRKEREALGLLQGMSSKQILDSVKEIKGWDLKNTSAAKNVLNKELRMGRGSIEERNKVINSILDTLRQESVNDAIITKTGKIITTHPDDNIIATKNDPSKFKVEDQKGLMDNEFYRIMEEMKKAKDNSYSEDIKNANDTNNQLTSETNILLKKLLEVMKMEKQDRNISMKDLPYNRIFNKDLGLGEVL